MADSYGPMGLKTTSSGLGQKTHPYVEFEATQLWESVDSAISALVKNGDIKEATAREYIVGFLCKEISRRRLTGKRTKKK
jgi:hypothetical protein